jgi:hypothetical protein
MYRARPRGDEAVRQTVQWPRRRGNAALRPFLILLHPAECPSTPARAGREGAVRFALGKSDGVELVGWHPPYAC